MIWSKMDIKFSLVISSLVMIVQAQSITVSPYCHSSSSSCTRLSTLSIPSSGNVSLVLLPGIHVCDDTCRSSLSIRERASFSLTGTPKKTVVSCTSSRSYRHADAELIKMSNIQITGITFENCNVRVIQSNNTIIRKCVFDNGKNGALDFQRSFNISIDRSSFTNNYKSSHDSMINVDSSTKFAVTRSNFSNNYVSSFSAIIGLTSSAGYVSCSTFHNNSAQSFGGVIKTESSSRLFVTNSSFTENRVDSFGGVVLGDSGTESVTIISCVFTFNSASSFGGAVKIEGGISDVIASNFSSNRAGSFGGSIVADRSGNINVNCVHFFNNSARDHKAIYTASSSSLSFKNTSNCDDIYLLGSAGVCHNTDCEVCHPPEVNLAMEFTEYNVTENIRSSNFALQVCAVATDVFFTVKSIIEVSNGTAEESVDFLSLNSECRNIIFTPKDGMQKHCTYIEILDDNLIEETEQFIVKLSSNNPQVTVINAEAIVFIMDDDGTIVTTQQPSTMATMFATTSAVTKATGGTRNNTTVLVECGIFSRLVTFTNSGDNLSALKDAIIQTFSFTGLESGDIAFLQIKLSEDYYQGHFLDVIGNKISMIKSESILRVIPYSKNPGICRV